MKTTIRFSPHALLLFGFGICAVGCTSGYRFDVDAVTHHAGDSELRLSYRLVPATPDRGDHDLQMLRAARDVKTALSSKGLFEAPAGIASQLDIEYDFGIEGPIIVTRTHIEPVVRYGLVHSIDGSPAESSGTSLPGSGSGVVEVGPPEYGTGRVVTMRIKEYRKFLRLTARPSRTMAGDRSVPTWSVVVENQDESDNLAKYVRLMTAAAMDVIGEDTTSVRSIKLTDRDGRVLFVQTGIPE